jgi:hypothetical protein
VALACALRSQSPPRLPLDKSSGTPAREEMMLCTVVGIHLHAGQVPHVTDPSTVEDPLSGTTTGDASVVRCAG